MTTKFLKINPGHKADMINNAPTNTWVNAEERCKIVCVWSKIRDAFFTFLVSQSELGSFSVPLRPPPPPPPPVPTLSLSLSLSLSLGWYKRINLLGFSEIVYILLYFSASQGPASSHGTDSAETAQSTECSSTLNLGREQLEQVIGIWREERVMPHATSEQLLTLIERNTIQDANEWLLVWLSQQPRQLQEHCRGIISIFMESSGAESNGASASTFDRQQPSPAEG